MTGLRQFPLQSYGAEQGCVVPFMSLPVCVASPKQKDATTVFNDGVSLVVLYFTFNRVDRKCRKPACPQGLRHSLLAAHFSVFGLLLCQQKLSVIHKNNPPYKYIVNAQRGCGFLENGAATSPRARNARPYRYWDGVPRERGIARDRRDSCLTRW